MTSKCAISKEADLELERMMMLVNEGFKEGRVSKQEMLSWLVLNFEKFEKQISTVREVHFDPVIALKNHLKEMQAAKRKGQQAPSVDSILCALKTAKKSGL